ncbi:MAG: hypothetical protein ACREVJ_04175 [Gammaproteobacteria bacterium]
MNTLGPDRVARTLGIQLDDPILPFSEQQQGPDMASRGDDELLQQFPAGCAEGSIGRDAPLHDAAEAVTQPLPLVVFFVSRMRPVPRSQIRIGPKRRLSAAQGVVIVNSYV